MKNKTLWRFALGLVLVAVLVVALMIMTGPIIGDVFSTINNSLSGVGGPSTSPNLDAQFTEIDEALRQGLEGSLAYNAPESMRLDETVTVELLLNPSLSPEQLGEQITEGGEVVTATVEVTPRMKAELKAQDQQAFDIQPLHDTPEQLVSGTQTTEWRWWVTAKKGGLQQLTLVVYRLVRFEGQDYWREVETYRSDIEVKVTMLGRLKAWDWKWLLGILLTAILIPAFWRWADKRNKGKEKSDA